MDNKTIDRIVWWIPFRQLRNDIRNLLLQICDINQKIDFLYYNTKQADTNRKKSFSQIYDINQKIDFLYYNTKQADTNRKKSFSHIYANNLWESEESRSGPGSTLQYTANLRVELIEILKKYNIKSFLDAPCGDMNWISNILNNFENYIGIDIVDEIIENNIKKYSEYSNISLKCMDLLLDDLPNVDMIFCRDCIPHLSNMEIQILINNIKRSNSKYLLISSANIESNDNRVKDGYHYWSDVNLEKYPFNFPKPIEYIDSEKHNRMGLWKISDIPEQNN